MRMLAATLDHADPPPQAGDPIPPLAHWLYLLPSHRQSELAHDGHVRRGGFMPPVPLPRRMFAGARVSFLRPLTVGSAAWRKGRVTDLVAKSGRSGRLVFASVRQEIGDDRGLALVEEQDIVYREPPRAGAATAPPPAAAAAPAEAERRYLADEALLLRYSALIFNAHRIHYDLPYTTAEEGYPGLVVHGQLVATCLADLARRAWGRPLASFSFRALRPLFCGAPFTVRGRAEADSLELWACDEQGVTAMVAEARLAAAGGSG